VKRRFKFRLERVLEAKRLAERRQQHELALLVDALMRTRQRRQQTLGNVEQLQQRVGQQLAADTCSVHELMLVRGEIDAQQAVAEGLAREIAWLEEIVARERGKLQELARARLVLERLRERAYADYLLALRRAEAAVLDDIRRPDVAAIWGS